MYTTLSRGGDGPNPVGLFATYEEAEAYARWAEDGEYEACAIADISPLYPPKEGD